MVWHIEQELPPSARSSAAARVFTADWLGELLDPAAQDTRRAVGEATLIVSELVTNAVQADSHELRLVLSLEPDFAVLTISVEDDAPGTPELATGPLTRPRGRGLLLVDALAQRWGTRWTPPGLKSVWAELTIGANRPWPVQSRPCGVSP